MEYTICFLFDPTGENVYLRRMARTRNAGKYNGLGGRLLPGETPGQCAARCVNESIGSDLFAPDGFVPVDDVTEDTDCGGKPGNRDATRLYFLAAIMPDGTEIVPDPEEPVCMFQVGLILDLADPGRFMASKLAADMLGVARKRLFDPMPDPDAPEGHVPSCTSVNICRQDGASRDDVKVPKLYETLFELPCGRDKKYLVTSRRDVPRAFVPASLRSYHPDGAVALVFDSGNEHLLLLREFRYAAGEFVYTLPGGLLERGEPSFDAVLREVYEETGLGSNRHPLLNERVVARPSFTAPAMSDQLEQLFVFKAATEAVPESSFPANPGYSELIRPIWVNRSMARALLKDNSALACSAETQALLLGWVCGADFTAF